MAARLLAGSLPDSAGRGAADAEVQHVVGRSQRAGRLFAAVDSAEYPYDFDPRTGESYLASQGEGRQPASSGGRAEDHHRQQLLREMPPARRFRAGRQRSGQGPRLDLVYKRLRPDYTLGWIADPKRILPYTAMPVNIPPDKPVSETLYHGTSLEQVNGVVDLLMNYDRFMEDRTSIKPMVKPAPPAAGRRSSRAVPARRSCNDSCHICAANGRAAARPCIMPLLGRRSLASPMAAASPPRLLPAPEENTPPAGRAGR